MILTVGLPSDIRIGAWRLSLTVDDAELAAEADNSFFLHDLAAGSLVRSLAPFEPPGEQIVVYDRLVLSPLTLLSGSNSEVLDRHADDSQRYIRSTPSVRRFRDRNAALAAFLSAVSRGEHAELWIWRALGFTKETEVASADDALLALAELGEGAWPLVIGLGQSRDLVSLWQGAQDTTVETLVERLAPLDIPVVLPADPDPAIAAICVGASTLVGLVTPGNSRKARAAARLAVNALGIAAFGERRLVSFVASAFGYFLNKTEVSKPPAETKQELATLTLRDSKGGAAQKISRKEDNTDKSIALLDHGSKPRLSESRLFLSASKEDNRASTNADDLSQQESKSSDASVIAPEDSEIVLPTKAGGLLFLLSLIPEIGLFKAIEEGPLQRLGLHTALAALAIRGLGVNHADPAVRAFSGLWPGRLTGDDNAASPVFLPRLARSERDAIHALTLTLKGALQRCGGVSLAPRVVIQRPGDIRFGLAEADLILPLDTVAIDIRKAGLDATPGFVPWLGMIVRIRYEER